MKWDWLTYTRLGQLVLWKLHLASHSIDWKIFQGDAPTCPPPDWSVAPTSIYPAIWLAGRSIEAKGILIEGEVSGCCFDKESQWLLQLYREKRGGQQGSVYSPWPAKWDVWDVWIKGLVFVVKIWCWWCQKPNWIPWRKLEIWDWKRGLALRVQERKGPRFII